MLDLRFRLRELQRQEKTTKYGTVCSDGTGIDRDGLINKDVSYWSLELLLKELDISHSGPRDLLGDSETL